MVLLICQVKYGWESERWELRNTLFPGDDCSLIYSLKQAFRVYRGTDLPIVWVHPGLRLFSLSQEPANSFKEALECA